MGNNGTYFIYASDCTITDYFDPDRDDEVVDFKYFSEKVPGYILEEHFQEYLKEA